jgi:hypothetical protein
MVRIDAARDAPREWLLESRIRRWTAWRSTRPTARPASGGRWAAMASRSPAARSRTATTCSASSCSPARRPPSTCASHPGHPVGAGAPVAAAGLVAARPGRLRGAQPVLRPAGRPAALQPAAVRLGARSRVPGLRGLRRGDGPGQAALNGLGAQFLWPDWTWWNGVSVPAGADGRRGLRPAVRAQLPVQRRAHAAHGQAGAGADGRLGARAGGRPGAALPDLGVHGHGAGAGERADRVRPRLPEHPARLRRRALVLPGLGAADAGRGGAVAAQRGRAALQRHHRQCAC